MRYYELTCLISPNLSEEELKFFQEKIRNFIQEEEGISVEVKNPVKKNLGYSIKNRFQPTTKTVYVVTLNFNLIPEKLENLEKKLKSENQIIRYLILGKEVPRVIKARLPKIPLIPFPKVERIKTEKVKLEEIKEKLEEILGES